MFCEKSKGFDEIYSDKLFEIKVMLGDLNENNLKQSNILSFFIKN